MFAFKTTTQPTSPRQRGISSGPVLAMKGLSAVHPSSVHESLVCLQEITDPWPSADRRDRSRCR